MKKLIESDYSFISKCPWCGQSSNYSNFEYRDSLGCDIIKCKNCGIVYAQKRLNESGLKKFWEDYESRVHVADDILTEQREKMYRIDFDFANSFLMGGYEQKILDVGCGNGHFMSLFEKEGYKSEGVEFGKEAAKIASKEHTIRYGEFDKMDFQKSRYNMIIFRGVLQYISYPKDYIKKAVELLDHSKGYLFITLPNISSLAARLFKENFRLAVTGTDFIGYTEQALSEYIMSLGLRKVGERYFYLETPYANEEEDLLLMAKAIKIHREGKKIDFKSPPYWGNMMTLMYKFS